MENPETLKTLKKRENIIKAEFITSATNASGYPPPILPEIAFIGRSNVGKSSAINCLARRRALAKTSGTPGKTRTINFFNIEDELYFADLPGYGYAKVSKTESAKWGKMLEDYLRSRENLVYLALLVDARRPPTSLDLLMYNWAIYYKKNALIIVTKTDKIKRSQLKKSLDAIEIAYEPRAKLFPMSAHTGSGRNQIWEAIDKKIFCFLDF